MTYTDIKNRTYFLAGTSSAQYPVADLTLSANNALDRIVSLIIQSDGRWQWDDTNYTDLPIATTTLTTDQQDYTLTVAHLKILRVEVKDTVGNWLKIEPLDPADLYNKSITDFLKTSGLPKYYDKLANSIFLYPKPNYTQAASLKIFFQRGPSYFTTADTTAVPGFNSLFHILLPLWAAYDYCIAKGIPRATQIAVEIQEWEDKLKEAYAMRGKDEHIRLSVRVGHFR